MRSILGGLLVVATAAVASAQTPAQIVVNNAPAGINIDIYLDAGKVQTVPINQQGTAGFDLDFLSLGKPQGQIYIETCKDGQRIRVISDGTTVPADEGCNRKPVGVLFTFTCTKRITINFAAARASFAGCGTLLTNKAFWIPVGAAVGTVPFLGGGDAQAPAPFATITPSQNISTNVSTPQAPVTTQPLPPVSLDLTGTYGVRGCTVISDRAQHEAVLRMCSLLRQLVANASNGGVTFRGDAPWVTIGGSYNVQTGEFALSATGTVAGFSNVSVTLRGAVNAAGAFTGVLEYGANGALPQNAPISWQILAQRQ